MVTKSSLLFVEDDDALRFGFVHYFSKKKFVVMESSSLERARALIQLVQFDAIILDIHLPDGSGLDFLTEIRAQREPTTVVILSAETEISDCLDCGANCVLTKPVSAELLHSTLFNLIGHRM